MPKQLKLRELTAEEQTELEQIAKSQTKAYRQVERAKIILWFQGGKKVKEIAKGLGRSETMVYKQIRKFRERGMKFLQDQKRPGRPQRYTEEIYGQIVKIALTKPEKLALPYATWTLDRLKVYMEEVYESPISRTRIRDILHAEGLCWYQEKTYFSHSPDPQFVEKRGRL